MYQEFNMRETKKYTYNEMMNARRNYCLQNYLVKSFNFPISFYQDEERKGDDVHSLWSDRISDEEYAKAHEFIKSKIAKYEKKRIINMTDEELILFLNSTTGMSKIDGFRIVEETNMSNGFEYYRIDVFVKGKDTPLPKYAKHNLSGHTLYNNEYDYYY